MLSILLTLHRVDAFLGIGMMLVAAVAGFIAHRRDPVYVPPLYRWWLAAGAAVLGLQVLLGSALLASGLRPSDILHIAIYGALSPLVIPGAYLYTRGRGRGHPNLAFGLVSLFLFGFLIRGLFTG